MSNFQTIRIKGVGGVADVKDGALNVLSQDAHSPLIGLYFTKSNGATALSSGVSINDDTIIVDSAASFSVGDYVGIFSGVSGEGRYYFGEAIGVSGSVITLDTPIDFDFVAGDPVISTTREMNIDGSSTPQTFEVNGSSSFDIDITRIMITMWLEGTPDDGLFGVLPRLTKGIVVRKVDGDTRNIFNIKDNGEMAERAYDLVYTKKSGGGGTDGLRCRITFAGQSKHGVTIRLESGEKLECIIRDDLSAPNKIERFRIQAQGHIVE